MSVGCSVLISAFLWNISQCLKACKSSFKVLGVISSSHSVLWEKGRGWGGGGGESLGGGKII